QEQTLKLRHRDLKQTWKLRLNSYDIATLPPDENDATTYWSIPPNAIHDGSPNELRIACATTRPSDDVMIGAVALLDPPRSASLAESAIDIAVTEAGQPVPCRITIVDANGSLIDLGAASDDRHAIRPGVVYTADGRAHVPLPTGAYTVYAGRGFAYSLDTARV